MSRPAPNHRPGVDAGWAFLFPFGHQRPRATQAGRCAAPRGMRNFAQNAFLLALMVLLAGCFMHTVVGNGLGAPSPDKRFSLGIRSHGASRKAYVDKTKKNIWISIYNRENTNSTVLFQQRYILTGSDIDWSIRWSSDEAVSVAFYDWGDGVSNYNNMKHLPASNHIASFSFILNRTTGKFIEKK